MDEPARDAARRPVAASQGRGGWREVLADLWTMLPWVAFGALAATAQLAFFAVPTVILLGHSEAVLPLARVARPVAQDQDNTADEARLLRKLERLRPRGTYAVIDTFGNRLRVYRGDEMLHEAVCSTGTGIVLVDPRSSRTWVFDSPVGERRVRRKVEDPVWSKPDWAFIEDGYLPPADPSERIDTFSLGDYALYMGDGYIIHGTLFQTLLGQGVTHGCVRLGDKDLEYVYQAIPVGARVYLY